VTIICGPPRNCTCPAVAWTCVCREGNVKRGCDSFVPGPRDSKGRVRCDRCDWFDWQHPVTGRESNDG